MKVLLIITIYIALGNLTGAWVYETNPPTGTSPFERSSQEANRAAGSIGAGVIWPLYWVGRASYAVVHSLREPSCQ